jgi:Tol biopolymer transport system component
MHVAFVDGVLTPFPESTGFWFISPDGTSNRMFQNYRGFTRIRWSPNGQWFLFGVNCEIWKMRAAGDSLTLVLSDSTGQNYRPAWSPDGRRIAFDRFQEDGKTGVYTMAANGTDLRYLGYGAEPVWSPDGAHIAYPGLNSIVIMDTSGKNRETLLITDQDVGSLDYSPDGSKIAFVGVVNKTGGLYVVDTDGRSVKLLDKGGCLPSWSPDGKRIVFVNTAQVWMPSLGKHKTGQFLFIINADGTGRRQLTFISGH